ncbi:hypothetical protein D9619_003862 [Psilocybe cf. subviscida]|uniref:F-box domain-containing protein n=1 Tax=Psilocybe cf. subviscida TaxID=2480587 RepID=A0A8H5AW67_9AGAR|nr:hypothetical protein D9619_003862 [Psilocybe cf. subviscida]
MDVEKFKTTSLPTELFRDIVSHLHMDDPDGKKGLLALALTCSTLREESQRRIFREMRTDGALIFSSVVRDVISTHIRFLQTVYGNPRRLGPYVRSYTQVGLACPVNAYPHNFQYRNARISLWEWTAKTLPTLINLKSLIFSPVDTSEDPTRSLLHGLAGCFQLEALVWTCGWKDEVDITDFLASQYRLRHLDVGDILSGWLGGLDDTICHSLTSITTSDLLAFAGFAINRNITALQLLPTFIYSATVNLSYFSIDQAAALERLRYLSASGDIYPDFRGATDEIPLNLVLLEVTVSARSIQDHIFRPGSLPELLLLSLLIRGSLQESEKLHIARIAFETFPKLENIMLCGIESNTTWRYSRPNISSSDVDETITLQEIHASEEVVNIRRHRGLVWWKVYDV